MSDQFNITALDSTGGLVEVKPVASTANETEVVNAVSWRRRCAERMNLVADLYLADSAHYLVIGRRQESDNVSQDHPRAVYIKSIASLN